MNTVDIRKSIDNLERIRDIILNYGVTSQTADNNLQDICNKIDGLYEELLKKINEDQ